MSDITQIIQLWQYPASFIFVGSFLGAFLFRILPPPRDVYYHFEMMARAGVVSTLAELGGYRLEERFANVIGATELAAIAASLTRRRRICLIVGLVLAAIGMMFVFLYLPTDRIPDWVYAVCAAIGIYQVWRSW
jgi:hypothetical protein